MTTSADPITDEFVMHVHTSRCSLCGNVERSSALYTITSWQGTKRLAPTKTRPAYRPSIVQLPTTVMACCEKCVHTLPVSPPRTTPRPRPAWAVGTAVGGTKTAQQKLEDLA